MCQDLKQRLDEIEAAQKIIIEDIKQMSIKADKGMVYMKKFAEKLLDD